MSPRFTVHVLVPNGRYGTETHVLDTDSLDQAHAAGREAARRLAQSDSWTVEDRTTGHVIRR